MYEKLIKYSCWCPEHDDTVYSQFIPEDEGPITVCPLNEGHTDISQIAIVDVCDETIKRTKIVDTDELDPSQARTVEEGFLIDIEIGVNPSHLHISFAYPVDLLSGKYFVAHTEHSYLDNMSVFVVPPDDAPVGTTTQTADIGAEEVYVDANALQNLKPGFYTKFQASEKEYRIIDVDYETGKLVLGSGLDVAVSVGHTVHLRIPFVINQLVLKSTLEVIGNAAAGSSGLPAGYVLRVDYNHAIDPTVATKLGFALAYKY